MIAHRRFCLILALLFAALWTLLAIEPHDRSDWALENVLVAAAAFALFFSYKHLLLSRISYAMIFIFLCLHAVGSHWTYSLVPYDQAFELISGQSLNKLVGWQRNQYDRIVHFAARSSGAGAHSAPIESQRCEPDFTRGVGDFVHHRRMHAAAVQRMRRRDDDPHGVGVRPGDEDSVECLASIR